MSPLVKLLRQLFARRDRGSNAIGNEVHALRDAEIPQMLTRAESLSARQPEEARKAYQAVLERAPRHRQAMLGLAVLSAREQRYDAARELLDRLVMLEPEYIDAWNAHANVARLEGRWQDACASYERALALDPDSVTVLSNLGTCLRDMGRVTEARRYAQRALDLEPGNADVLLNFATVLIDAGEPGHAESSVRRALEIAPDMAEAHAALSHLLLVRGSFDEGWREYEWRHRVEPPAQYPYADWRGEQLERERLLVRAEQGLGDQIMFASCLNDLAARAKDIVVECDPRLEPIFARSFPGMSVHAKREDNPERWHTAGVAPDRQVFAGSLPRYFRNRWQDFPERNAYLRAEPAGVARWRARLDALGSGPKIGISWQGGTVRTRQALRSTSLSEWLPLLLTQTGTHWISLQYGQVSAQAQEFARAHAVLLHHWQEAIDDYEETAALIAALDGVISVQTAAVHLAGALGQRAWVMVPHTPEWRYLAHGERLPWYASVAVLRQQRPGDWGSVIEAARARLAALQPSLNAGWLQPRHSG